MWEVEGIEEELALVENELDTSVSNTGMSHSLVLWLIYFIALLQKRHCLPNAAISFLLAFLSLFLKVLSRLALQLSEISEQFPKTVYELQKRIGVHKETFVRYVTCENVALFTNMTIVSMTTMLQRYVNKNVLSLHALVAEVC